MIDAYRQSLQTIQLDRKLLEKLPNISEDFLSLWDEMNQTLGTIGVGIEPDGKTFIFEFNGTYTDQNLKSFLMSDIKPNHKNKQCISKYSLEYSNN